MAAHQAKRVLTIEPSEKDQQRLQQCLVAINNGKFDNRLTVNARWDYPSAVEPRSPSDEIQLLPADDQAQIAKAIQAYSERDFKTAKQLLLPFSNYDLQHVNVLFTSTLRHLKEPEWFNSSQSKWRSGLDALAPAVASIEVRNNVEEILVHPALSSIGYKAPRYVLAYVLYHECLHKILRTKHYNPHPPIFRRLEACAPNRESAIEWLKKHRFATIEDLA